MFAIIENNIVTDTLRVDPYTIYPNSYASRFVECPDGVERNWVFSEGIYTPAIIDIEIERISLINKIDFDTDYIYKSVQGNRATEYLLAESEANAYKAANYTGTVPGSITAWAQAKNNTFIWATDDILETAANWRNIQSAIRATRLACKEQARVADNISAVSNKWSDFLVSIKLTLNVF